MKIVNNDKYPQDNVFYREASGKKMCGNCDFVTSDGCEIVDGPIKENGVCNSWGRALHGALGQT